MYDEVRYGGYNTFGSPDDAQNPWSPRFIQANQYSTVMANYSYFGSYPPVSWKLEKDGTSSIDYSVYLSWDPVPGSSCSASKFASKEEDNIEFENKVPGDIADLPIGGFATKGVKRSIPSLLLYLGMHHYMNENLDSAAMVFQKVINTYPDSLESLFALDLFTKMLYESNTDTIYDFISTFEDRFGDGNPLNAHSLTNASLPILAGVYMRRNNPNAAIGIFNRINNNLPASENVKYSLYSMLSYYLNVKNEVELAENIFNRLSEKFPTDPILVDAMILMNKNPEAMLGKVSLSKTMNPPPAIVEKSSVDDLVVEDFALDQNYPNPFNPSTIIQYQIPIPGTVKLKIYDMLGAEVVELVNAHQNEGQYRVTVNLVGELSLSSGMYYYVIDVSGINGEKYRNVKKMMVLK